MELLTRSYCLCVHKSSTGCLACLSREVGKRDCWYWGDWSTHIWELCFLTKCPVMFPTYPASWPLTGAWRVGMLRFSWPPLNLRSERRGLFILGIFFLKVVLISNHSYTHYKYFFVFISPTLTHIRCHTPRTVLASCLLIFKCSREIEKKTAMQENHIFLAESVLGFVPEIPDSGVGVQPLLWMC